jgi:hypothetical protein
MSLIAPLNGTLAPIGASRRPPGRSAAFTAASTQYLSHAAAVASSYPFSVALWFRTTGGDDTLWGQFSDSGGDHGDYLYCSATTVGAYSDRRAGGYVAAGPTAAITQGTWHLAVAVWASDSSRSLSLDGGYFAVNSAAITGQSAATVTVLGVFGTPPSTIGSFLAGNIDHPAMWSRALDQSEATAIYNGGSPLDPRAYGSSLASGLVAAWPLDEYSAGTGAVTRSDVVGSFHMTDTNNVPSGNPAPL